MTKIEFVFRMASALQEIVAGGARLNPAVATAQAALESQWGNSTLAQEGNNLFSIKTGMSWAGETIILPTKEWKYPTGWRMEMVVWRKYKDWTACIRDYAAIIATVPWYRDTEKYLNNPAGFLQALLPNGKEPGWAMDPDYFSKVERIGREIEAMGGPIWSNADSQPGV